MRIFSRLTILASGFTRRPRSRCRRSSSSTSSRDISRFPPITRSLARPQFRFLPGRCTVCTFVLSFFSSSPLPRFRFPGSVVSIFATLFDDTALYTHTHTHHPPTHPPTHPPKPPRMPQGVYSSNGARVEEPSDTIRWNTVDRSIARSTERTTLESIEQEAANLLVRLQPQSAESAGAANASHPYRMPQMLQEKFADDFPLRKTGTYARPRADTRCYTINSRVVE